MGSSRETMADEYGLKLAVEMHERLKRLPEEIQGVRTFKTGESFVVFAGATRIGGVWFVVMPKSGSTMRDWQNWLDELGKHEDVKP